MRGDSGGRSGREDPSGCLLTARARLSEGEAGGRPRDADLHGMNCGHAGQGRQPEINATEPLIDC